MNPLEAYLHELREIRASGAAVNELSYYAPLAELLNEAGKKLKPKVRCIQQLKSVGAGIPDFGLFTADQFQRASDREPLPGQKPARGVVEVKGTADDAWQLAESKQVARYLEEYHLALATNYRDFLLVGQDAHGKPAILESYRLAENEAEFWSAAAHPRRAAETHGERFLEFLQRALLHAAPLADPKDLAWFLASYARDARARLEQAGELPALATLRQAMESAMGLQFQEQRGEHFFRSTLVQTLFYGVFSGWVLWRNEAPDRQDAFDWRLSAFYLHVPVIQSLFHQLSDPAKLKSLGLMEFLDRAGGTLNRVDRQTFFARFEQGQAVQYFYEPFLEAYDPELRKALGVWYTPPEIIQYMVARVDTVLRQELGAADGLADPDVLVLDPCCGTGAYLVEVLKRIAATLKERGENALLGYRLKRAALERVFGFELLPAPFVIAHLQLGLLLQQHGAPLDTEERAGVYLTNALTGWDLPEAVGEKARQLSLVGMPELQEERDAARHVKREAPILVVLGNPPYNAFAGTGQTEERELVRPYKEGLIEKWGIKKFNLDELYVRFFRLAERRIAEMTGRGVVCFISNFSYLGDPSFVVARQRFLSEFDSLWFDCMNGDSRETGKLTPDGQPDPSVFSTEYNREGIRVGTAVGLMVRRAQRSPQPTVRFRHFWGMTKRVDLLASLKATDFESQYQLVSPTESNRFSFRPVHVEENYSLWPRLVDLCKDTPISGLQEMRKGALMDVDRNVLEERMRVYYNPGVSWDALAAFGTGLTEDGGRFNARECRSKVLEIEKFDNERIRRYALYPLDFRWCYYSLTRPLWNEPRPALARQNWPGNSFVVTRMMAERPHENTAILITSVLPDYHLLRPNCVAIPIRIRPIAQRENAAQMVLLGATLATIANLSSTARAYLAALGVPGPDSEAEIAPGLRPYELIWLHALAVGYAPAYLRENADGIRQDWPRIPLPAALDTLIASAALGRQVAALLDTETPVPGVTSGSIRPELKPIAVLARVGGGALKPGTDDLAVTVGWGHAGKGGVTMPGKGKLIEHEQLPEGSEAFGKLTYDVYLNDVAYWRNIPPQVWDYTIGGYQVIKKWLSYRERGLLDRPLTAEEATEVTHIARRIAALVLLEPTLDANYQAVKASTYAWPGTKL